MVTLRTMSVADLPIFQKWLAVPHVAKWYHHPLDWVDEVQKQDQEFCWIHHFIVEQEGVPIGFCQYYACKDSDELWEGYTALGGSYSMDYFIGETEYLRKGIGKQMVEALLSEISLHSDLERIVVQPEPENEASCGLLLSCGFLLDAGRGIYVKRVKEQVAGTKNRKEQ